VKCNHCGIEFHPNTQCSLGHRTPGSQSDFMIESTVCPACYQPNLYLVEGVYKVKESIHKSVRVAEDVKWRRLIYPLTEHASSLPPEVPNEYRSLYNEASAVLPISPRASAALARTLLEMILVNQGAPKSKDLFAQIEWCLTQGVPTYISESLDDVRKVGKFAAHFKQNACNGEVLEVEPGEAEFVLVNVVNLLDFYFVMPAKVRERSEAIRQKLETTKQNQGGL